MLEFSSCCMFRILLAFSAICIGWVGIGWVGNGPGVGIGSGVGNSFLLGLGASAG